MKKAEREARSSEGEVKIFFVKENWEPAEECKEKFKTVKGTSNSQSFGSSFKSYMNLLQKVED